jgi:hypothetical protein
MKEHPLRPLFSVKRGDSCQLVCEITVPTTSFTEISPLSKKEEKMKKRSSLFSPTLIKVKMWWAGKDLPRKGV